MLNWLGMPSAASAHAGEIDQMIVLIHWLMLVLFAGWGAYFVFVLFRFSRSRNPKANYQGVQNHASQYVEIAVAVVEGILLVAFAVPAWAARVNQMPPESTATNVRVVAEQFAWNIHYPGPDGRFGRTDVKLVASDNPLGLDRTDPLAADDITTINQLNLPVNQPVLVHLSSKDVIHSFWIPSMRVKQDAVPGMTFPVWFVPNKTGEDEIVCSQLCGLGHYRMRGFVTIQTADEFQAWLREQAAVQAGAPPTQ